MFRVIFVFFFYEKSSFYLENTEMTESFYLVFLLTQSFHAFERAISAYTLNEVTHPNLPAIVFGGFVKISRSIPRKTKLNKPKLTILQRNVLMH